MAEESKHAHAVIVIDKEDNQTRDVTKLIMADEGTWGKKISIPSLLINWNDGQQLVKAVKEHDEAVANAEAGLAAEGAKAPPPVLVELVWDIPVNNVVTMDLWMGAASREAHDFLKVSFRVTLKSAPEV